MNNARPAIVSDIDREWAMAQMPEWCQRGDIDDEFVDDGGWLDAEQETLQREKPSWAAFVAEEIEKFEKHYNGERKSAAEWSSIWRQGWWPRVMPRKRFPQSAPKIVCPFFRRGMPEFDRALKVATAKETRMWTRHGIAQFLPDDKRLKRVVRAQA